MEHTSWCSRQSSYPNEHIWVSSSSSIFPVLNILTESSAVILLCLEFALISPEHFFTFLLGCAFLRFCLSCCKAVSAGEHQCLEDTECP